MCVCNGYTNPCNGSCTAGNSSTITVYPCGTNKGWECPKCGRCFAPHVNECSYCPAVHFSYTQFPFAGQTFTSGRATTGGPDTVPKE